MNKLLFNLTTGINERVAKDSGFAKFVLKSVKRHFRHDFTECSADDTEMNIKALINGERIFNIFHFSKYEKIWIITEAEPYRNITTVLFPEEY